MADVQWGTSQNIEMDQICYIFAELQCRQVKWIYYKIKKITLEGIYFFVYVITYNVLLQSLILS